MGEGNSTGSRFRRRGRIPMGSGGEFDLIRKLLGPEQDLPPGVDVGPGDDCAVLEGGLVISADLSMEGIHFQRDWLTSEEVGYRATAAALSDLAAMAAEPLGALRICQPPTSIDNSAPAASPRFIFLFSSSFHHCHVLEQRETGRAIAERGSACHRL